MPPKVYLLFWQVCNNKVASKENLMKRGIVLEDNGLCSLCGQFVESNTHLFLHYSAVWPLWNAILQREGVSWAIPGSLADLASEWSSFAVVSDAMLWNLSPFALVWEIWSGRNDKHFNNKGFQANEVWDMHLMKIYWWTKYLWKECPFDSAQFITNFCDIKTNKAAPSLPRVAVWQPPAFGLLKFNVDGASKGNPGPSGIGGVVRNHNNTILGYFSKNVGHDWAFSAEVKAILHALIFCHQFLLSNIVIESDSTLALGWVLSQERRPFTLLNDLNHIDYLARQVNCLGFHHVFREANDEADKLAKEGCNRDDFLWVCLDNPEN